MYKNNICKKKFKKKKCRGCSFEQHKFVFTGPVNFPTRFTGPVNTNLWRSKLHTRHFFFEFFFTNGVYIHASTSMKKNLVHRAPYGVVLTVLTTRGGSHFSIPLIYIKQGN